jgi:DNA-binding response OmpR family regulator
MPHVLVADDDAWIVRMIATVLEKRGYSVATASDGEEALALAEERTPDLLITDVMMPRMDGWALVRHLRSRAEFAGLPVIFLTALSSEDDRIRGFRLGADDYMAKPFRFEELDLRVTKTLRRTLAAVQQAREQLSSPSLRGDLSQMGLSSLLILIELERKTGQLTLHAPIDATIDLALDERAEGEPPRQPPVGIVLVRDGRIVHARLESAPEPVDADCVYHLLTWPTGEFEFTACLVEGEDRVGSSTTALLMEAARRLDEERRDENEEAARLAAEAEAAAFASSSSGRASSEHGI